MSLILSDRDHISRRRSINSIWRRFRAINPDSFAHAQGALISDEEWKERRSKWAAWWILMMQDLDSRRIHGANSSWRFPATLTRRRGGERARRAARVTFTLAGNRWNIVQSGCTNCTRDTVHELHVVLDLNSKEQLCNYAIAKQVNACGIK